MDVVFISPGNSTGVYQDLSDSYTAIEPPTWALLLAQSCRAAGFEVGQIIDANAEKLSKEAVAERVAELNPRLVCFVVYGQNVNAGTTSMAGALLLAEHLKKTGVETPISFVGSHVQSLPMRVLEDESSIDFVFTNEGVYALRNILALDTINPTDMSDIKGVAWRKEGTPVINTAEKVVPNNRMDEDLPGYAWDLLPYDEKPVCSNPDLFGLHV
jgi:anaerobic magnesium-protoporphyrin IX monomethyl ester cyclase